MNINAMLTSNSSEGTRPRRGSITGSLEMSPASEISDGPDRETIDYNPQLEDFASQIWMRRSGEFERTGVLLQVKTAVQVLFGTDDIEDTNIEMSLKFLCEMVSVVGKDIGNQYNKYIFMTAVKKRTGS